MFATVYCCAAIASFMGVAAFSTSDRPKMYIWNWDDMDAIKADYKAGNTGPVFEDSLDFLLDEINGWKVMDGKKFSVTQQSVLPGSGDNQDYQTIGYYAWPCKEAKELYGWGDGVGECTPPPNNECVDDEQWGSIPYILCDGIANREASAETAKYPMQKMTRSVTTLALLWFYREDDKYARTAANLLRYFFLESETAMNPNLQWAQYRPGNDFVGFGIIEMGPWSEMLDAIAIIRTSEFWSEEEHEQLMNWMNELLRWLEESDNGKMERNHRNNHGTWFHNTAIGISQHAKEYHTYARNFGQELFRDVPNQLIRAQIDDDGLLHEEVIRSRSIHYVCYTLTPFLRIRSMAEESSNAAIFDGTADRLLQQAIRWTYPYMQEIEDYPYRDVDVESGKYGNLWQRCIESLSIGTRIFPTLKTENDKSIKLQRDEAYCIEPRSYGHPTLAWDENTLNTFGDVSCF